MAVLTTIKEYRTPKSLQTPLMDDTFDWDLLRDGDPDGVTGTIAGDYELRDIALGEALVIGFVAVEEAFVGGTSVQFKCNGDNLSGAVATANLAAGDVVPLVLNNGTTTQSGSTYAKAAAKTLDVTTVGTFTAGKVKITLLKLDIANLQAR